MLKIFKVKRHKNRFFPNISFPTIFHVVGKVVKQKFLFNFYFKLNFMQIPFFRKKAMTEERLIDLYNVRSTVDFNKSFDSYSLEVKTYYRFKKYILFLHAFGGCETISARFLKRKSSIFQNLLLTKLHNLSLTSCRSFD